MARNLFVIALIFLAIVGVARAAEAPTSSPKSSPTPSTPKASAPIAESPKTSPAPPTSSDSPAASPSDDEEVVDIGAPAPGPSDEYIEEESSPLDEESISGASSLKVSAIVAITTTDFFAF